MIERERFERRYISPDEEDLVSFAKLQLCSLGYWVSKAEPWGYRPRLIDPETGVIGHVHPLARGTAQVSRTRNGAWAMCADDYIRRTTEAPDRDLTTEIIDLRASLVRGVK